MSTRIERMERAMQIIRADPGVSKRSLQVRIRAEFGVGLSDTTRRSLLQQANTPSVLRARLAIPAFTHHDRLVLRKALHRAGNAPYLASVINEYSTAARDLHKQGYTTRETRIAMRQKAREQDCIATRTTRTREHPDGTIRGRIDWWKLLRVYRDRDIDRGEYIPQPRPTPRTDKGDIAAQKIRYQDRQATKAHERWVEKERARLQNWIAQKDRAIEVSTGARRAELEAQRANLEQTRRSIR